MDNMIYAGFRIGASTFSQNLKQFDLISAFDLPVPHNFAENT